MPDHHPAPPDKITVRLNDPDLSTALAAAMARTKKDQSTLIREALHWFLMAEDPAYRDYIEQTAQDAGRAAGKKTGSPLYRTDLAKIAALRLNDAPPADPEPDEPEA